MHVCLVSNQAHKRDYNHSLTQLSHTLLEFRTVSFW